MLGVTDKLPRRIVGTAAFDTPDRTKIGLFDRLHLRIELIEIMTTAGRILSVVVPSRPLGRPVNYKGRYLMRAGSSLQPMSVDQLAVILGETQVDFSAEIAPGVDATVLDDAAIAAFRSRWERKSNRTDIAHWSAAELLESAELTVDSKPTYAGLILLGTAKGLSRHLAQAEAVFEYRSSETSIAYQQRQEFRLGFFLWFDDIWKTINLRNDVQQFREGRIRQSPRLLEIESPGGFPDGITPDNVRERQNPRNRRIAEALARRGLVERSGQGPPQPINQFSDHYRERRTPMTIDLTTKTGPELVAIYNQSATTLGDKPVARFGTKADAIRRTAAILARLPTDPEPITSPAATSAFPLASNPYHAIARLKVGLEHSESIGFAGPGRVAHRASTVSYQGHKMSVRPDRCSTQVTRLMRSVATRSRISGRPSVAAQGQIREQSRRRLAMVEAR